MNRLLAAAMALCCTACVAEQPSQLYATPQVYSTFPPTYYPTYPYYSAYPAYPYWAAPYWGPSVGIGAGFFFGGGHHHRFHRHRGRGFHGGGFHHR
jgi:hypothetical protein